ncbi:MAG: hypothetical protein LBB50_03495 [Oscillospiraceae bacterium]|jgi:hypothetical protein|nr:hypothetical protein [Oscillospiraceae bacterium]
MKKRVCALALACLVWLSLAGCSHLPFKNLDSLMHPPTPEAPLAQEIFAMLQKEYQGKGNVVFRQPLEGTDAGAILPMNLLGGAAEELIVFYSVEGEFEVSQLYFAVFVWQVAAPNQKARRVMLRPVPAEAQDVIAAAPCDLNHDGRSGFLVRWKTTDGKRFGFYTVVGDKNGADNAAVKLLCDQSYDVLTLVDFDGDKVDEVFCATVSGATDHMACAYRFNVAKNRMETMASVPLDPETTQYLEPVRVVPLRVGEGICFDAMKHETGMVTELVLYNPAQDALLAPLETNPNRTNAATFRAKPVRSRGNADKGIPVEIPSQYAMPGSSGGAGGMPFGLVRWNAVHEDGTLRPREEGFIYFNASQAVQLPEVLRQKVTVHVEPGDPRQVLHFCAWDGKTVGEELFWVRNSGDKFIMRLEEGLTDAGKQQKISLAFLVVHNNAASKD